MNLIIKFARPVFFAVAVVALMSPLSFIYAQESTVSPQEQCFALLKENMTELI